MLIFPHSDVLCRELGSPLLRVLSVYIILPTILFLISFIKLKNHRFKSLFFILRIVIYAHFLICAIKYNQYYILSEKDTIAQWQKGRIR